MATVSTQVQKNAMVQLNNSYLPKETLERNDLSYEMKGK